MIDGLLKTAQKWNEHVSKNGSTEKRRIAAAEKANVHKANRLILSGGKKPKLKP